MILGTARPGLAGQGSARSGAAWQGMVSRKSESENAEMGEGMMQNIEIKLAKFLIRLGFRNLGLVVVEHIINRHVKKMKRKTEKLVKQTEKLVSE